MGGSRGVVAVQGVCMWQLGVEQRRGDGAVGETASGDI